MQFRLRLVRDWLFGGDWHLASLREPLVKVYADQEPDLLPEFGAEPVLAERVPEFVLAGSYPRASRS